MKPFVEKGFRGLDLSADADSIGVGFLSRADNVIMDGAELVVRPGFQGQLSAATGNPLYALTPFPSGSTSSSLLVSNSRLYKWTLGGTSLTEVLDGSGTSLGTARAITVADAFIARSLNLAYLVDGTATMYRCDLTDARAVTSLTRPSPPSSTLGSDYLIDDGNTYTNWVNSDTITSAETLTDGSFESGSVSGGVIASPTSWTEFETGFGWDSVDNTVSSITAADSTYMCRLDRPGEARYQRITPETLSNPDGAMKKVRHFVLKAKVHSRDTTGLSSAVFQVSALDSSNNPMSVRTFEATPAKPTGTGATDWVSYQWGVGFTDLESDPDKIEVAILAADTNTATVYVDKVELFDANVYPFTFDGAASGFDVYLNATTAATAGRTKYLADQGELSAFTNGLYITRDLGGDTNLSYRTFKAKIKWNRAAITANPTITLRLGFRKSSGGIYWSALGYSGSGDYMYFDASNIDPTVLAATRHLYIQIVGDQEGGVGASGMLYAFDGLFGVGNLTGNVPYWYKLIEMNSNSDTDFYDVIESDVSTPTELLVMPDEGGMVKVTLPARTNASADYLLLVRYGGTLIEDERGKVPFGYIVCAIAWATGSFAFSGDSAKGTSPYEFYRANPYVQWTKTGSTGDAGSIILDNTPDGWLAQQHIAREGKDNPPGGPDDVAVWYDRVWLAKDAEVWGSWSLSNDKAAGLYYSRVVLPAETDPMAHEKGYFQRLQVSSGDYIQRIVPYGKQLLVFTRLGLWVGTGDNPLNFAFQEIPNAPGLAARRAVCVFLGQCFYLAPDGLYAWDGKQVRYAGEKLRRALYPQSVPGGTAISPTALASSWMVAGGRFMLLGVPGNESVEGSEPSYSSNSENATLGALGAIPNSGTSTVDLNDGTATTYDDASSVALPDHRITGFMDFGSTVSITSWSATVRAFEGSGGGTATYSVDYSTNGTSWTNITSGSLTVSSAGSYPAAANQNLSGAAGVSGRYLRVSCSLTGAAAAGVGIGEMDAVTAGTTTISDIYCLSAMADKPQGWTKLTGVTATGGAAFESSLDSAEIVLCGTGGQLFKWSGLGDKATSGASATAVSVAITTREYGDSTVYLQPGRIMWGIYHDQSIATTYTLTGSGPTWSKARTPAPGNYSDWTRVSRAASGRTLQAGLTFSTSGVSRIENFALEASASRILR